MEFLKFLCLGKTLSGIILVTISKYCHSTNQVLPKCFLFKIYKKDFWTNAQFSFWTGSNEKPDDFTKVNKKTEWTDEYACNFYGFYLKNYWFESVFSRYKENLLLKLIMTYSNLIKNWEDITSRQLTQDAGPDSWSFTMFSWLLGSLHMNQKFSIVNMTLC